MAQHTAPRLVAEVNWAISEVNDLERLAASTSVVPKKFQAAIDRSLARLEVAALRYEKSDLAANPSDAEFPMLLAAKAVAMLEGGLTAGSLSADLTATRSHFSAFGDVVRLARQVVAEWERRHGSPGQQLLPVPVSWLVELSELLRSRCEGEGPKQVRRAAAAAWARLTFTFWGALRTSEVKPFRHGELLWHQDRLTRRFIERTKADQTLSREEWAVIGFPPDERFGALDPRLAYRALVDIEFGDGDLDPGALVFSSPRGSEATVKYWSAQLFGEEAFTLGVCRRSWACWARLTHQPTSKIQQQLRHKHADTTQAYLGLQVPNTESARWMTDLGVGRTCSPDGLKLVQPGLGHLKRTVEMSFAVDWDDAVAKVEELTRPKPLSAEAERQWNEWARFCERTGDGLDPLGNVCLHDLWVYISGVGFPNSPTVASARASLSGIQRLREHFGLPLPSTVVESVKKLIDSSARSGTFRPITPIKPIERDDWADLCAVTHQNAVVGMLPWSVTVLHRAYPDRLRLHGGFGTLDEKFFARLDAIAPESETGEIPAERVHLARRLVSDPVGRSVLASKPRLVGRSQVVTGRIDADGTYRRTRASVSRIRLLLYLQMAWLGPFKTLTSSLNRATFADVSSFDDTHFVFEGVRFVRQDDIALCPVRTLDALRVVAGSDTRLFSAQVTTTVTAGLPSSSSLAFGRAAHEFGRCVAAGKDGSTATQAVSEVLRITYHAAEQFVARHALDLRWGTFDGLKPPRQRVSRDE